MKIEKIWQFHAELSDRAECKLKKPLLNLSKKGLGKLSAKIDHLRDVPQTEWDRPHASPLNDGKYVIRFKDENSKQHRVFGYFNQDEYFVMCLYGTEKDGKYDPSDYKKIVENCKKKSGKNIVCRFAYPFGKYASSVRIPDFDDQCGSCV